MQMLWLLVLRSKTYFVWVVARCCQVPRLLWIQSVLWNCIIGGKSEAGVLSMRCNTIVFRTPSEQGVHTLRDTLSISAMHTYLRWWTCRWDGYLWLCNFELLESSRQRMKNVLQSRGSPRRKQWAGAGGGGGGAGCKDCPQQVQIGCTKNRVYYTKRAWVVCKGEFA